MKSSAKNVKLASVDDLFSTEQSRQDESREKVVLLTALLMQEYAFSIET